MSEFKEKVNELVSKMEQGEDGKWVLPEEITQDLDEPTLFAVTAERRYRDTQSSYTRAQQEAKKQEAVAAGLQERLLKSDVSLTKEQKHELNELRTSSPEKWRDKLNEYEQENKTKLETELEEIRKVSRNKGELEVRKEQMAAWSESTGIALNDEIVNNELPPKYLKDLETGKITFEEFLDKAGQFLGTEKVIEGSEEDTTDDRKNLGRVAGGQEPSKEAQSGDFVQTYEKNTVF